jgi:nitroimidazol reductase NimA-like FMN-containing flavoprotein (pyridoxamine 5'-phosphate oxidase superfamily)
VCVTFCTDGNLVYQHPEVACSYRMDSRSVICKGEVTFIDDISEKELILNQFMAKYTERSFTYSQPALRNVKVWRIKVNEMTAKAFGQKHNR